MDRTLSDLYNGDAMTRFHNSLANMMKFIFSCIIATIFISLSSCNYLESEQSKLQKAQNFFKDNKFNQAIVTTKNILQSDPGSCEARILLGKSQFAKFSLIDAQDSLEKAKNQGCKDPQIFNYLVKMMLYRNNPAQVKDLFNEPNLAYARNLPESQLLEGELYFLQNNYDRAKTAFTKYFAMSHDGVANCLSQAKLMVIENDFKAVVDKTRACEAEYSGQKKYDLDQSRYLRAVAQVKQKDIKAAKATLNLILDHYSNPKDPNVKIQTYLLLMNIYLSENDIDRANEMANAILQYIATPRVYYVKGLKHEKDNRYDLAEKQLLEALKLDPNYRPALLELANIKYKEGNIEQAKYYTGKADALAGENVFTERLDELLAVKYFQAGDLDLIIDKLSHSKSGGSIKSQYILALAYAKKGDDAKAWEAFGRIEDKISDKTKKDLLKARLYVALHDYKKAENIFVNYASKGDSYAIAGLTRLYLLEHKYANAENLLIDAVNKNSKNTNAVLLLAEVYSITRQKQKLFAFLDRSIKSAPANYEYKLERAKMYYKYAMYQDAVKQCDRIITANPAVAQAFVIKANSHIRLGDLDSAKETYMDLLKRNPRNDYAYLMLSYLADKESRHHEALTYLDKALEINPRNMNAVYTKIEFLIRQNNKNDALDFARSTAKLLGQKQAKALLLGFAYKNLGDKKNAYLNYKESLSSGDRDIHTALEVYKLSADVNGSTIAGKELDEFLHKNPELKNLFYAASYFMNIQNYAQAAKYYEDFIKQDKTNPAVYNNLAWLKLHKGNIAEALIYANQALALAPDSPAIMDTMGQVLLQKGDYDKAGSYLLNAYKQIGNNPSVKFHLAQYYYYSNNLDKSRTLLKEIAHIKFPEQVEAQKLLTKITR